MNFMGIQKYKKPILIILIYYIFLLFFFGLLADVPDRALILLITLVIFPLMALGGLLIGSKLLSLLFLFIHTKILGRGMVYGIEDKPSSTKFDKTWRGIFPALMAITFTLMFVFNKTVVTTLASLSNLSSPNEVDRIMNTFILLLIVTIFISCILFGGIWALLDAGLVYSNVEKVKNTDKPTEQKSVGGFFQTSLKGYAGIGALLAYYQFAVQIMEILSADSEEFNPVMILVWAFYIPFPILIAITILPGILFLDMTRQVTKKYIHKWAKKFGITKHLEFIVKEAEE